MKKMNILTTILFVTILAGCSLDTSEEKIQDSEFVLIIKNIPEGVCDLNIIQNQVIDTIIPFATLEVLEEKVENATCEKYGFDSEACTEIDYPSDASGYACVIGADTIGILDADNLEFIIAELEELTN